MTAMVLTAAYLNITGPGSIHDHTTKIELTAEVEEKDVTTFASLGWKEVTGGLKKGGLAATFLQDIVDDALDEDMWTIFLAAVPVAFEVRLTQSTVTASNPKYTGLVLPKTWAPLKGSPGDVAEVEINWPTSGVITRGTT